MKPNLIANKLLNTYGSLWEEGQNEVDITLISRLQNTGKADPFLSGEKDPNDTEDNPQAIQEVLDFASGNDPDWFDTDNHDKAMSFTSRGSEAEQGALRTYAGVYHYRWLNASMREGADASAVYEQDYKKARGSTATKEDIDPDGGMSFYRYDMVLRDLANINPSLNEVRMPNSRGDSVPFQMAWSTWMDEANTTDKTSTRYLRAREAARKAFNTFAAETQRSLQTLANQPLKEGGKPMSVLRGVNCNTPDSLAMFEGLKDGRTIDIGGMISTTADPSTMEAFTSGTEMKRKRAAKSVVMKIAATRGVAANPLEQEVILNPGKFKVKEVRVVKNGNTEVKFVELEQLVSNT